MYVDEDDEGQYVELETIPELANIILQEDQQLDGGETAAIRVCISKDIKRAVVIKEDDLLTKQEIKENERTVTKATLQELKIWIEIKCFSIKLLKDARNLMTSRYVAKWKRVHNGKTGQQELIIRMR